MTFLCKVLNIWKFVAPTNLNQARHMTHCVILLVKSFPMSCEFFNPTWFDFWITFSMVKILFKSFMKEYTSIYTFQCLFLIAINNIFLKIQRPATWNMFQQCWLVHEFWLVLSIQLQVTLPTSLKITNMHLGTQISKSFLGARSIRNLTRGFKD
jgi:hypothetical protein